MKRSFRPLLAVGLAAGLALSLHRNAQAQTAIVTIDGVATDISSSFVPTSFGYQLPTTVVIGPNGELVTVSSATTVDPFMTYSFTANNLGNVTSTYDFTEDVPVMVKPVPGIVRNSIGGTLTSPNSSETLTPTGALLADARVNGAAAGIPIGTAETVGFGSTAYGPTGSPSFNSSTIVGVPISTLGVTFAFSLTGSGTGSVATLNGDVSTSSVPEPGAVTMMLSACVGGSLLFARRMRRRA